MNQINSGLIIIGLTIVVVILINVGIIFGFRKGSRKRDMPYRAFGEAMNLFKNPRKNEDEQINELSSLLDSIEENTDEVE